MNIIHTTKLSDTQKEHIRALVLACREAEPLSLSAPTENGLDYFLLYKEEELISLLFLFFPEKAVCECGAFTSVTHRRQGYFSELLGEAMGFLENYEASKNCPVDFCFLVDSRTPSAACVLKALGAEYWYSEYKMERALTAHDTEYNSSLAITRAEEQIYTASLSGELIGTCVILPTDGQLYFYGFEIKEDFQGRGYGKDFLLGMLAFLAYDRESHPLITLQVSGRNTVALSLYKKAGFLVTETLSYYWY